MSPTSASSLSSVLLSSFHVLLDPVSVSKLLVLLLVALAVVVSVVVPVSLLLLQLGSLLG